MPEFTKQSALRRVRWLRGGDVFYGPARNRCPQLGVEIAQNLIDSCRASTLKPYGSLRKDGAAGEMQWSALPFLMQLQRFCSIQMSPYGGRECRKFDTCLCSSKWLERKGKRWSWQLLHLISQPSGFSDLRRAVVMGYSAQPDVIERWFTPAANIPACQRGWLWSDVCSSSYL